MSVKKNLKFILLFISFGSLQFVLASSEHIPSKKQKNSTQVLQSDPNAWYFCSGARGLTGNEFVMQNARVWLAEKSIATVDIDKLAAGIMGKSIDADMIDRQTDSIFAWLKQAHADEKLLRNLQYNPRYDHARQDHERNCLDAICCGAHQQESEQVALQALDRCRSAKKLAEKILYDRAKGTTARKSAGKNMQSNRIASLCYCILFILENDTVVEATV
jgi:hypothetical protein